MFVCSGLGGIGGYPECQRRRRRQAGRQAGTSHEGVTGQVNKIADANIDQLQCPASKILSPPGARARGGLGRPPPKRRHR
eukprot:1720565-Pyramimonas_sp.AAC.1